MPHLKHILATIILGLTQLSDIQAATPALGSSQAEQPVTHCCEAIFVKTNLPAWGMLWMNAAVEWQSSPQWSVALPVYWSPYNYFSSRVKFRTLTFQPEIRHWFGQDTPESLRLFVGAHFGLSWYNAAFNGDTRYQDHRGRTPALGGGIAVGVRWHVGSSGKWMLEASLGAGCYHLDYDEFQNRHNGLLTGRVKRTFWGIDQASFSLVRRFDINHKSHKPVTGNL